MFSNGSESTALMQNIPKVAVIYLSFHSDPYFPDVVEALRKLNYPKDRVEFVIVDNPHPVHGLSNKYVEEHILPISGTEIPHATYLPQPSNGGFGIGNNAGVTWALEHGFDYIFFHNNDAAMGEDCILKLVEAMEADPTIGIAQSMVLLFNNKEQVNSSGNAFHYLGFGYCNDYKKNLADLNLPAVYDVPYASGAALMVRASVIREHGAWDENFFMYHEDLEWSLRLRVNNFRAVCVRDSIFFHKYEFSKSISKYFWMERNRFAVLLMFYKWPTLLLILPILIPLEIGLFLFAAKGGWVAEKIKVYEYWTKPSTWKLWLSKRKIVQAMRKIDDKEILKSCTAEILFQEDTMQNPLLTWVANPIMRLYYRLLMAIMVW
jgi:GT2 family glycosyltransferase